MGVSATKLCGTAPVRRFTKSEAGALAPIPMAAITSTCAVASMAKMESRPPLFDGRNFSYWKSRMGAYLDALGPDVWNTTKTSYTGALTPEQQKWNANDRNTIIEGISEDVFARIDNIDLSRDIWLQLIQLHEGSSKVREQKYHLLRAKYDEFKMLPNECCNDIFFRLNLIMK
jgi:hypothetical protein